MLVCSKLCEIIHLIENYHFNGLIVGIILYKITYVFIKQYKFNYKHGNSPYNKGTD